MFQEFMGTIGDTYDDVSSFFDDLVGDSDVLSVVSEGIEGLIGGGEDSGGFTPSSDNPEWYDYDDTLDSPSGVMGGSNELDSKLKKDKALESVNGQDLEREWIERLRAMSNGRVYGNNEDKDTE